MSWSRACRGDDSLKNRWVFFFTLRKSSSYCYLSPNSASFVIADGQIGIDGLSRTETRVSGVRNQVSSAPRRVSKAQSLLGEY